MKYRAICENHLYQKAYAKGQRCVTRTLALYILRDFRADRLARANPEKKKINRIGLAVGKKVGGAVTRNRVKRILREAYRQIDRESTVKTGFLVVIAARDAAAGEKTPAVKRDLLFALRKTGMLS